MPDQLPGVKISTFPDVSEIADSDRVTGLKRGGNANFTFATILTWIRNSIVSYFVPNSRTINGQALSTDISLDADDVGAEKPIQLGSVSLSASWSGSGPYTQTVTVSGATVTANSKVDVQLTAAQIASLISAGVTGLVIENNAGALTAYAVGASTGAMTIQVTVTEVTA